VANGVVNGTYLLSPTRILNYRSGITRRYEGRQPINQGKVDIAALGFPTAMASAFDAKFAMFPTIATGYATFGMDGGDPIRRGNTIYTLVADASEVRGRHTFKLGADFRLYDQTPLQGWPGRPQLQLRPRTDAGARPAAAESDGGRRICLVPYGLRYGVDPQYAGAWRSAICTGRPS
jgi:hypothetical protein